MSRQLFRTIVMATALLAAASSTVAQSVPVVYGEESPQVVGDSVRQAIPTDDLAAVLPLIAPSDRRELGKEIIAGTLVAMEMLDPNSQIPGSPAPPPAELAKQRANYTTAVGLLRQALKPHGLEGLVGQPLSEKTEETIVAAVQKADIVVLGRSVLAAMERIGPMMGMPSNTKKVPFTFTEVRDYEVQGDRATAKAGTETLQFERVDERWYIKLPAPK